MAVTARGAASARRAGSAVDAYHRSWSGNGGRGPFVRITSMDPGVGFAPHVHDYVELEVVAAGRGWHRTAWGREAVRAGSCFFIQPGSWHAYDTESGLQVYNCLIGLELLDRELACLGDDPRLSYLLGGQSAQRAGPGIAGVRLGGKVLRECRRHFERLLAGCEGGATLVHQLGHLALVLDMMARDPDSDAVQAGGGRSHPAVQQAVHLMREAPERPWSLGELACAVFMRPSGLVRAFHRDTGQSPMAYLRDLRCARAGVLLVTTDLAVRDIGARVGWPDVSHFSRRFRAHHGVSPSEYRRSARVPA